MSNAKTSNDGILYSSHSQSNIQNVNQSTDQAKQNKQKENFKIGPATKKLAHQNSSSLTKPEREIRWLVENLCV
jgi:hypothetical protein